MTKASDPKLKERIYPAFKALNAVTVAKHFAIAASQSLAGTGLSEPALAERTTRVTLGEVATIYHNIQCAKPNMSMALAIGDNLGPANYGVYGYAIATSVSLGRGFEVMVTYPELATPVVRMAIGFDECKRIAWIDFIDNLGIPEVLTFNLVSHLAMFQSFFGEILPVKVKFHSIDFACSPPPDHSVVASHFGCPVNYGAQQTSVRFPLQWLSAGLRNSDSLTEQNMRQLCEKYCQFGDPARPLSRQVAILMQTDLRASITAAAVADAIGISERGLRRKLSSEGTQFHELLTNYRKKMALDLLLRRRLTAEQVAHDLGFASKENFRTAFKSWFGMTISEYKKLAG
jgi:AraC-like DNA-binding protein